MVRCKCIKKTNKKEKTMSFFVSNRKKGEEKNDRTTSEDSIFYVESTNLKTK